MKLDEVIINNFRQYQGEQIPLRFSRTKEKNVTVIFGVNGAGKSNLFKAINWCIYGNKILDDEGVKKGGLINKEAIRKASVGAKIEAQVKVNFLHNAERYMLTRTISCIKESEHAEKYLEDEFFLMKINAAGITVNEETNRTGIINSILPENVRTYFLFDGEKIDNFSKPGSAKDVKNAIYNILKLEVLDRSRQHLESICSDYRKELKQVAGHQIQKLIDDLDNNKENKIKKERAITLADEEMESAKRKVKEIDKALEGMKESSDLQKERENFEIQMTDKALSLDEQIISLQQICSSPLTNLNRAFVSKSLDILDEKRKKGEIPSNIREQFVMDLIDSGICICGNRFEENSSEYDHLIALKKTSLSGALEEEVLTLTASLNVIKSDSQTKMEILDKVLQKRKNLRDEIETLEANISEISHRLKDVRFEDVRNLEIQRENFITDIGNYQVNKGIAQRDLLEITEKLKTLEIEIRKAEKNREVESKLINYMNIAQKGADTIDGIYQDYANKMRLQIEKTTKSIFDKLIWKEGQFKDITLDPDYNLQIIDRWNKPASPELSAGERQVLSLAFIAAMAVESGGEAPLVMDTPFGRLSRKHRENITSHLPELTEQLILFVTDEELTADMQKILKDKTGNTYELSFDKENGCTEIKLL